MTFLRFIAALLGAIGMVLCAAGCLAVWYVESRVDRAQERVLARVDRSFSSIDGRLIEVQKLAAKSKITIEEVQERVQILAKSEARDRLAALLELEPRIEQVADSMRQAQVLVELSGETVEQVRQALDVGVDLGLTSNADLVDPLAEWITDVNERLNQVIATVEKLRQHFGDGQGDESAGNWKEQAATSAARLLATFGEVDSRLISFRGRLTDAQNEFSQLNKKTHRWLIATAVCTTLFLFWMAAGQYYLWRRARTS